MNITTKHRKEVEEDLPDEKEFKPTPSYSAKSRMLKYLAILILNI